MRAKKEAFPPRQMQTPLSLRPRRPLVQLLLLIVYPLINKKVKKGFLRENNSIDTNSRTWGNKVLNALYSEKRAKRFRAQQEPKSHATFGSIYFINRAELLDIVQEYYPDILSKKYWGSLRHGK